MTAIQPILQNIRIWFDGLGPFTWWQALLTVVLFLVLAAVTLFVLWRLYAFAAALLASKQAKETAEDAAADDTDKTHPKPTLTDSLARAIQAVRYLTTWREWRYQIPWYLVLGDEQSGKTSLLQAVRSGRRQQLLLKEKRLAVNNTGWHFFNQGVVIDIAGKCATTRENSRDVIAWNRVLIALEHHRPQRPVDGIILTVSAEDLLTAKAPRRMQQLADMLYPRLWQVQKQFGFALPIYVIVTKADLITGFQSFWQAHSARRREEIFGWSSPYTLETAFSPDWITTAFGAIADALGQTQIKTAAQCRQMADADGFFLFPQALAHLEEPLKELLSRLFEPSAFHAAFQLRGLYFSGSLPVADGKADTSPWEVAFADQLFSRKIFAEPNLAQPIQQVVFSRTRLIRRAQIAALALFVIGCAWLAHDTVKLNEQVTAIAGTLQVLEKSSSIPVSGQQVFDLLTTTAQIKANPKFFSMPVSWFGNTEDKISQEIADTSFEKVIFPTIDAQLLTKAEALNAAMTQPSDDAGRQLEDLLNRLIEYQLNLNRFARLSVTSRRERKTERIDTFIQLLHYLYPTLQWSSLKKNGQHRLALRKVAYTPLILTRTPLTAQVIGQRLQHLQQTALAAFQQQVQLPQEIVAAAAWVGAPDQDLQPGQALAAVEAINGWQNRLTRDWLAPSSGKNPCQQLDEQFQRLGQVMTETNDLPAFDAGACSAEIKQTLLGLELPPYGKLFEDQDRLSLQKAVQSDLAVFQKLAALGFMRATTGAGQLTAAIPASWDMLKLQQALGYYREFEPIATSAQNLKASADQPSLALEIARRQLANAMAGAVTQAQQAGGQGTGNTALWPVATAESILNSRVTNLVQVQDQLEELLHLFAQLKFTESYDQLQKTAQSFAEDLLHRLSSLAADERLYLAVPHPQWQKSTYSQALFGLNNTAQITAYLTSQRKRTFHLASLYANPLVAFLLNTGNASADLQSSDLQQWQETLTEIDRYQKKDPTSSLAVLENYFNAKLVEAVPGLCDGSAADTTAPPTGIDLYAAAQRNIADTVDNHCHKGRQDYIASTYQGLASQFNSQLAGRYPFAADGTPTSGEVSIIVVRNFFEQYGATIEPLLTKLNQDTSGRKNTLQVITFLRRLQKVADFFDGNLITDASQWIQPIAVKTTFRMFPEDSQSGDQIIRWRLTNGAEAADYPGKSTPLTWQFGQKLALSLQWATSSSYRPMPKENSALPTITDQGVIAQFAYHGQWSLLRLLRGHNGHPPRPNVATPQQAVLKFVVPLRLATIAGQSGGLKSSGGQSQQSPQCLVYLGLDLSVTDPKTQQAVPLTVPANFPSFAPTLTTGTK